MRTAVLLLTLTAWAFLSGGCGFTKNLAREALENAGPCRLEDGVSACGVLRAQCKGRFSEWQGDRDRVECSCCDDALNPPD